MKPVGRWHFVVILRDTRYGRPCFYNFVPRQKEAYLEGASFTCRMHKWSITYMLTLSIATPPSRILSKVSSNPVFSNLTTPRVRERTVYNHNKSAYTSLYQGFFPALRQNTIPPVARTRCNSFTSSTTSSGESGLNQSRWSITRARVRDEEGRLRRTLYEVLINYQPSNKETIRTSRSNPCAS